jgi:hypothetical protein
MNPANVVRLQTQLGISKLPLKKISLLNGIASFVKSADSGRRLMTTSSQTLRMDFAERKGRSFCHLLQSPWSDTTGD